MKKNTSMKWLTGWVQGTVPLYLFRAAEHDVHFVHDVCCANDGVVASSTSRKKFAEELVVSSEKVRRKASANCSFCELTMVALVLFIFALRVCRAARRRKLHITRFLGRLKSSPVPLLLLFKTKVAFRIARYTRCCVDALLWFCFLIRIPGTSGRPFPTVPSGSPCPAGLHLIQGAPCCKVAKRPSGIELNAGGIQDPRGDRAEARQLAAQPSEGIGRPESGTSEPSLASLVPRYSASAGQVNFRSVQSLGTRSLFAHMIILN